MPAEGTHKMSLGLAGVVDAALYSMHGDRDGDRCAERNLTEREIKMYLGRDSDFVIVKENNAKSAHNLILDILSISIGVEKNRRSKTSQKASSFYSRLLLDSIVPYIHEGKD